MHKVFVRIGIPGAVRVSRGLVAKGVELETQGLRVQDPHRGHLFQNLRNFVLYPLCLQPRCLSDYTLYNNNNKIKHLYSAIFTECSMAM